MSSRRARSWATAAWIKASGSTRRVAAGSTKGAAGPMPAAVSSTRRTHRSIGRRPTVRIASDSRGSLSEIEARLSEAILTVGRRPIERWVRRVLETAAGIGPAAPFVDPAATRRVDPLALIQAAVAQDLARLDEGATGDAWGVLRGVAR